MGTPFSTSAPYELTETTLTMKGAVVGDGGMMGINKEEDIVFTINEDGSLTSTQKIYGNTQSTAYFAIQLSSDKFVPEATTPEVPETPETPEAQDTFTYTSASPATEEVQSYMSYITLNFGGEVAEVKTDAINVVDGKGNVVTTATLEADWFDTQVVGVTFADELSYTGTCSLTVPAQFITSTDSTYNPEFTLTYNLEAEAVEAYFYHPEYNAVMVMDSVANVATIKKNFTEEELAANAWELHPVGKDQYMISNKATGLYLGTCKTSVAVAGVDVANAKVYEMQKDGIYDVLKDVEGGDYNYLHAAATQNDKVVGWAASAAASHWFVLNSVEDYAYLAANLELTDSLTQMVNKAEEVKGKTQSYYKPLITDATQFNSNNKDPEEGSYAALLDGDNTTFFHSNWHGGGPEPHDLQVMLPNNDITEFLVKYESRNSSGYRNDRPVKMSIYGGTRAEDGTVTFSTTPFANLTTADGIGEVAGEFKFTADTIYDAFKFEVHETVMTDGTKGKVFFTYGEFQMYSQALTPAEYTMPEMFAEVYDEILANAKNANPVEDSYSALIEELNRAINKVLYPAATVVAVDPACGHYAEMPGTIKLTFSEDVNALEFGMVRTDFTGFRGYTLSEEDYTIEGKDLTITVPTEYVYGAADMMISLQVVDAKGQYVTYASDADYLSDEQVFLMYSADRKSNLFVMTATDPEAGVVEKLDVINVTFGEGNTYVGGFDTTKEVVVLNANDEVVTKATMEVVEESEVDPDSNETVSWPTSTVKFTLAAPVTEAGEYTLVVPEGTVYNEGFYEDAEDFGVEWGAIYNPEVRVAYTIEAAAVEEYPINFDKDQDATRTDRVLSTVSLAVEGEAAQVLTVANTRKAYNDMTAGDVKFVCAPAATLTPAFNYSGVWMHGYVYVDFGQDGDFSFDATQNAQTGKDLVSYSFYGVDSEKYGYNSANQYISGDGRSTLVCPAFTAPETPGEYRVRFKVDWNNVDAGGCVDSNNHILNNGGYIVDATLVVDEATAINGVSIENMNDVYTLDGRKVVVKAGQKLNKGLYIVGGKKVYVK
jgi:methionine-rich copper-binding protein CopC